MKPVNLSKKNTISFWAKGDGQTYTLIVLTEARSGQSGEPPAMTSFTAGPGRGSEYSFPFSTFETDGSDLSGIGFIGIQGAGSFEFQIDEVEIK